MFPDHQAPDGRGPLIRWWTVPSNLDVTPRWPSWVTVINIKRGENLLSRLRNLQNLRTPVDKSDSSWRSGDSGGQSHWSRSTCRTWAFPKSGWKAWCPQARNFGGQWARKRPKITFELFQKGWNPKKKKIPKIVSEIFVLFNFFLIFLKDEIWGVID